MIIKRENNSIILYENDNLIEKYELGKEIDFSKLASFLLKKDFSNKVELIDQVNEKVEQENNIVDFIQKILDDYNKKVDIYKAYLSEHEGESDQDS